MSETETETGPTTSWRDKTLKTAGYSYIVGDVAGAASSIARGDFKANWNTALGFGVWGAGGAAAAFFGNTDTEKQIEILAHKLELHLAKKGISIPQSAREQSLLLQDHGLLHHVARFLYEHPSEVLNAAYAVGAGMMMRGGLKAVKKGESVLFPKNFTAGELSKVSTDFWSGMLVALGGLGGLMIKEDPHAQERAKDGGPWDKTKAYFSEKALRLPGLMYGLNNIVLAGRVLQESKKYSGQTFKPHYFSAVTLATYVFSNLMLQFSTRSQIAKHLPASAVARLEEASAVIIAGQPPEMQQALLADISAYMATQKGVNLPAERIAQDLAARVTQLTGERMQMAANEVKWVSRASAANPQSFLRR